MFIRQSSSISISHNFEKPGDQVDLWPCAHHITHKASDLIEIFCAIFTPQYQTRLICGHDEPMYVPVGPENDKAKIIFAYGYFSSALHEIAHWCLASQERRNLPDYGYWYIPNRNELQQQDFLKVEVKPQALEWIFSVAAGYQFNFSADNLSEGGNEPSIPWIKFQNDVRLKVLHFINTGLPVRGKIFAEALAQYYSTKDHWMDLKQYQLV